jgi:hypothetical protein
MLKRCAEPGCDTFVLGGFCLDHELPPTRVFVRGRPFVPAVTASSSTAFAEHAPFEPGRVFARGSSGVLVTATSAVGAPAGVAE